MREGEKTLVARVKEACADLGNISACWHTFSAAAPVD